MKLLKNLLFLSAIFIGQNATHAQSLGVDAPAELTKLKFGENKLWVCANEDYKVVLQSNKATLAWQNSKHDLVVFDKNNVVKSNGEIDIVQGETEYYAEELINIGNVIYILCSSYDKSTETRTLSLIPMEPGKASYNVKAAVKIGTTKLKSKNSMHLLPPLVKWSPDAQKLMIASETDAIGANNHMIWVVDTKVAITASFALKPTTTVVYDVSTAYINNSGNVYVLAYDKAAPKSKKFGGVKALVLKDNKVEKTIALPAASAAVHSLRIAADIKNNIHIAGFYTLKGGDGIGGTVSLSIKADATEAESWIQETLPQEIIDLEFSEKQQEKGKEVFGFSHIFYEPLEDGRTVFIAEEIGSYSYTGANNKTYSGTEYGHVFVFCFSAEGEVKWGKNLLKNQKIDHPNFDRKGGIFPIISENNIFILFSDVPKNANAEEKPGKAIFSYAGLGAFYSFTINIAEGTAKREQIESISDKNEGIFPFACKNANTPKQATLLLVGQNKVGVGTAKID